ncbi:TIGR03943 family protein [Streptomyces sp. NPDC002588]|uniref:TIGR03943 family putative permease subunit n=1 Tax=Streptomyces sp. NPDC002588 TaxID=3154419 RepID=UPI0033327905
MKRPLQAALLVLSGLGLLHVSLFTDLYLRYVKPRMLPLLIASGVLLLLLGLAEAWYHWRPGHGRRRADHADQGHSHGHSGVPKVAWLLFLPALSLLFYAPPALGAYTASRQAPKAVVEQDDFDPLPATSPVPMTLGDFTSRVQQDRKQAVKGRSIQMTGFVTPGKNGGSWYLTRLMLNCCAADAQSVQVQIYKAPALSANTWVTVTGTWHAGGTLGTSSAPVALDAQTVKKVDRPSNGYTDALPPPSAH